MRFAGQDRENGGVRDSVGWWWDLTSPRFAQHVKQATSFLYRPLTLVDTVLSDGRYCNLSKHEVEAEEIGE